MGELRFAGLATGINTAALIKQLMILNSRRLAAYQVKKISYESQTTAMDELRAKVKALQSATSGLSDTDTMEVFSATSSDKDILTISTNADANSGSHTIEVKQLATNETWIQDVSTFSYEGDYVGIGTFIYSYNNKEVEVNITSPTTIEEFAKKLNDDDDNPGVTASLLLQGGKYHLMLSGRDTGEDYQISINDSRTQVWEATTALLADSDTATLTTKITELDALTGDLGDDDGAFFTISGTRTDGTTFTTKLAVNTETTIEYLIDEINSRFEVDGVETATATFVDGKIHLTDNTFGLSSLALNDLEYDGGTGASTILATELEVSDTVTGGSEPTAILASLLSGSFTETQTAQNSQIKMDDYTPTEVGEVQTLSTTSLPTSGSFTLTYGGETTVSIAHDASRVTIQAALDGLSTAITVDGNEATGLAAGDLEFTFPGADGNVGLITLTNSTLNSAGVIVETTKGNNSQWVSGNSNTIANAITGITVNLHDVTEVDEPIKITVSRDIGAISSKISSLVSAYNALIADLNTKTKYDLEAKEMGILSKDVAVSFIGTITRNPFFGFASGFDSTVDSFLQASDIGLSIDVSGTMEFDADEFADAIEEDFGAVLEILGANKSGNLISETESPIEFVSASEKYTTAGTYELQIDTNASDEITEIRIRLEGETTWRIGGTSGTDGLITFNHNDLVEGKTKYPEDSLQFSIDLTNIGAATHTATINIKQGIASSLEDLLDGMLELDGRFDISDSTFETKIISIDKRIKREEDRLNDMETRLIAKYARLEKTLSLMQMDMGAISAMGIL